MLTAIFGGMKLRKSMLARGAVFGLLTTTAFAGALAAQDVSEMTMEEALAALAALEGEAPEQPVGSVSARLAYNTDRGAIAGVGFQTNRFLGYDQEFSISAEVGQEDSRFAFGFSNLNIGGDNPTYGLRAYRIDQRVSDTFPFSAVSTALRPEAYWDMGETGRLTAYASFSRDEINDVTAGTSALIVADEGARVRQALGIGYETSRARAVDSDFAFGVEIGQSDDDRAYVKATGSASFSGESADGNFAYGVELSAGAIQMSSGTSSVGERFFLGQNGVRGFEFGGYGPRDLASPGDPALGGNRYVVARFDAYMPNAIASVEWLVPGVFFDVGSLWGLDDTDGGPAAGDPVDAAQYWRASAGVSLLVAVGAGQLRFDFARPIQMESYDRSEVFQISYQQGF